MHSFSPLCWVQAPGQVFDGRRFGTSRLQEPFQPGKTTPLYPVFIRAVSGDLGLRKRPTATDLQGLAAEVAAEIKEMESLCRDRERNIPLAKESFPLTENLGYCRNCQFRELCDRVEGVNSAGI